MAFKFPLRSTGLGRRIVISTIGLGLGSLVLPETVYAANVVRGTVIGKDGWLFLFWDNPREANLKSVGRVSDLVSATVAMLKAAGIATIVTLIPSKSRIYPDVLPEDLTWSPDATLRYDLAVNTLRSGGALVPDLMQTLSNLRKARPDEKVWFKCDTHWTAWAAEHSAVEVAKRMKEQLNLPPSRRPGLHLGPAVTRVHTRSDLSTALPADLRAAYPDESYKVQWPVALFSQAALTQDEVADIAVVGSSFLQPKYNFTAMLSNQLERPVTLHWRVHNFGPYATMLSYLTSNAFKQERPKAVVWSFLETDMQVMPDNILSFAENAMTSDIFLASIKHALKI
jgi:alginate O-acetyltransferase complex protein AlgJ